MRVATLIAALAVAACTTFTLVHPVAPTVHTSAQLEAALRRGGTIVLADGVYDARGPFRVNGETSLVAAHTGRAILHAGLSVAGPRVTLRGLVISVSARRKAQDGAAVEIWGGPNSSVDDLRIDGHRKLDDGLVVRTPAGFVGRHIVVHNLTDDGIIVDTYPKRIRPAPVPVLEDVDVAGVARPVPRSSNGTGEACLWLGVQVKLNGAKLRDCAWDGLWTGFDSVDSTYENVDVDRTPVGVYLEHYTTGSTFSHLRIGSHVRTGVNCEWADPAYGRRPACVRNTVRDSDIESYRVGVFLDEGTRSTSVVDSAFAGQSAAAIVDFRGRGNSYTGNAFASGVTPVTHDHP